MVDDAQRVSLLVVDDRVSEFDPFIEMLRWERFDVSTAASTEEALKYLDRPIDLVITDIVRDVPEAGFELLQRWKASRPETPFIVMSGHGSKEMIDKALALGAEDYLTKPVDIDELSFVITCRLESRRTGEPIASLQRRGFEKIVGNSPQMLSLFGQMRRAALSDATVLILGESGAGKEFIAETIHHLSPRKDNSFVAVNMTAAPEHLIESELFGHAEGSLTGGAGSRVGRFEAAHKGTLFIDEIGDFAPASQAKLLRVLENHSVTPVGSNEGRMVDVRVVAATSRNLEQMVADEKFHEDLYYRLNVITLRVPPLRDRREDIPQLAQHFLKHFCQEWNRDETVIEPDVMKTFEDYDWPGNVRQLRNCIASMVAGATEPHLTMNDLSRTITYPLTYKPLL